MLSLIFVRRHLSGLPNKARVDGVLCAKPSLNAVSGGLLSTKQFNHGAITRDAIKACGGVAPMVEAFVAAAAVPSAILLPHL